MRSFLFALLKILFYLVIGTSVLMLISFGFDVHYDLFGPDPLPWEWNREYSRNVTGQTYDYENRTGIETISTVDGLRIYKISTKDDDWYTLRELFARELVLEIKDKNRIREFVFATREGWYDGGGYIVQKMMELIIQRDAVVIMRSTLTITSILS